MIRDVYNRATMCCIYTTGGRVEVATSAHRKWYAPGTHRVRVNRGWCPLNALLSVR